jgi:multidrug efflux pump subunit AcrB
VFLTTITTVAGLLPIAHAPAGDPFLKPMALSFAYGLMFATFVTLVFVPSFFIIFHSTVTYIKGFFTKESEGLARS